MGVGGNAVFLHGVNDIKDQKRKKTKLYYGRNRQHQGIKRPDCK